MSAVRSPCSVTHGSTRTSRRQDSDCAIHGSRRLLGGLVERRGWKTAMVGGGKVLHKNQLARVGTVISFVATQVFQSQICSRNSPVGRTPETCVIPRCDVGGQGRPTTAEILSCQKVAP